jgi:DNA-binding transcriptional regulator PaaX
MKNSKKPTSPELSPLTQTIIALLFSGKHASQKEMWRQIYGIPREVQISRSQVNNAVTKLKQHGWIEKKIINDKVYYAITKQGKTQALIYNSKTFSRTRGKTSTIVIFDIPEEKRTFRNFVRRLLQNMDFTMLQRSVFITPYILPEDFYTLLREMKLLEYFLFIEGRLNLKI